MARGPKSKAASGTTSLSKNFSAMPLLRGSVILLSMSLATFATKRAMHILYGTAATEMHLSKVVLTTLLIAAVAPPISFSTALVLAGILLISTPTLGFYLAVWTGRLEMPVLGSVVTLSVLLGPLIFLGASMLRATTIIPGLNRANPLNRLIVIALSWLSLFPGLKLWEALPPVKDSYLLFTLSWLAITTWLFIPIPSTSSPNSLYSRLSKLPPAITRSIPVFLTLLIHLVSLTQPPTRTLSTPYTHPSAPVRILFSAHSLTGQIVVGESLRDSFRYLRVDHSLLGGMWIGTKSVNMDSKTTPLLDAEGVALGDPIYSTFVLQEAVRLVETGKKQQTALVIGLGAGISTNSLIQHNLDTTIVEIDPVVYEVARRFFGLQQPAAVFLEDAGGWVTRRAKNGTELLFDVVVHDVFSGGGVPAYLFTVEFFSDLKKIMHPEGVVAVNFVGVLGSDSSKAVLATLRRSFGRCRAFHDFIDPPTEKQFKTEFINIVFFCTLSTKELTFRDPQESDFLSSYLRHNVLSSIAWRELDLRRIKGAGREDDSKWVLTTSHNPLGEWQQDTGIEHWTVMRSVLPSVFWETY